MGRGGRVSQMFIHPHPPFPSAVRPFKPAFSVPPMRLWESPPRGGSPRVGALVGLSIYMPEIETVCVPSVSFACPFPCLFLLSWLWAVVVAGGSGCGGGCVCAIMGVWPKVG